MAYHDGIVVTDQEKILFGNQSIHQIFNISDKNQNQRQTIDLSKEKSQINHDDHQDVESHQNQKASNQRYNRGGVPQQNSDDLLIEALKNSIPKKHQSAIIVSTHKLESEGNQVNENEYNQIQPSFQNIWDYVTQQKECYSLRQHDSQQAELDGVYFKYKIANHIEDQSKKILQVFSRKIQLGQKTLLLTTLRDQSHWLEIEKQKNMSMMKTIAFASTAHEFRNPLNAINSSLHLLHNKVSQAGYPYLETALNCSQLMLYLINDILDFSQIESKSIILNFELIDIKQLVKQCYQILQIKADIKCIQLNHKYDDDFPILFRTDKNRLAQILINLISNAIKYTQNGYVKLIGKVDKSTFPNTVRLIVEDTGVGMTQEQIKNLFQAFTKIKNNRHMNKEGVGLGLAISKNIAQALGGDIIAESIVDIGSQFTLKLPLYQNQILIEDLDQNQARIQQECKVNCTEDDESPYNINYSDRRLLSQQKPFESHEKFSIFKGIINKTKVSFDKLNFGNISMKMQLNKDDESREYSPEQFSFENLDTKNDEMAKVKRKSCGNRNNINLQQLNIFVLDKQNSQNFEQFQKQNSPDTLINSLQRFKNKKQDSNTTNNLSDQFSIQGYNRRYTKDFQTSQFNKKDKKSCNCAKILIVDDEPFNVLVMNGILNELGHECLDNCYDGLQAIEKIKVNNSTNCQNHLPYQLIILDNQMPKLNGIETAKIIRKQQSTGQMSSQPQVVLLTGDESILQDQEYLQVFDKIMIKPIKQKDIKQLLKASFQKQQ
eukprot:403369038